MSFAVAMQDVSFGYEANAPIMRVKELFIEAGKRVFIHGAAGSGKTTLLCLIAGVLHPQRGSCEVLGKDLAQLSMFARDHHRGAEMGYIVQDSDLTSYLSVRENIQLPCRTYSSRRERIASPTINDEVNRISERLKIRDLLDRSLEELSRKQQQRVAIARAVIGKPSLVVVDEQSRLGGLSSQRRLLEDLIDLCKETSTTLIFVSSPRSLMSYFDAAINLSEINQVLA